MTAIAAARIGRSRRISAVAPSTTAATTTTPGWRPRSFLSTMAEPAVKAISASASSRSTVVGDSAARRSGRRRTASTVIGFVAVRIGRED